MEGKWAFHVALHVVSSHFEAVRLLKSCPLGAEMSLAHIYLAYLNLLTSKLCFAPKLACAPF